MWKPNRRSPCASPGTLPGGRATPVRGTAPEAAGPAPRRRPPGAPLARGEPGRPPVTVDVAGLTRIDLAVVDTLARLQLTARRQGTRIELSGAGPELMLLLALVGLSGPAGIGEAARAGPG
ncbi:STAS domain-containing protein [Streptomyces zhihengii]